MENVKSFLSLHKCDTEDTSAGNECISWWKLNLPSFHSVRHLKLRMKTGEIVNLLMYLYTNNLLHKESNPIWYIYFMIQTQKQVKI